MMFASDLDRTLIFSKSALRDFPNYDGQELIPIEKKSEEKVAFMTKTSYGLLQTIASKLLFVPVTTRSLEEYNRILFHELPVEYAVTTNGANIFYNGRILSEWNENVRKQLIDISIGKEELIESLSPFIQRIPGEMRIVEDLFVYFYLSESIDLELLDEIKGSLLEKGWRLSLQGRKLYFMPIPISKGRAVKFIQEREGKTTLIGAGDSLFDDDFLQHCQYPFVPSHGELARSMELKKQYILTQDVGVKGGEELLRSILKLIDS